MATRASENLFSVYVINLETRKDRRRDIEAELAREKLTPNWVTAVDASNDKSIKIFGKFRNEREVACWKSHLTAAKLALEENKAPYAVVLEDDAILRFGFAKRLNRLLSLALPDASSLRLGTLEYQWTTQTKEEGYWVFKNSIYGMHAMLYPLTRLPEVVSLLEKCEEAVDDYLSLTMKQNWCLPTPLVDQGLSPTDINSWGGVINRSFLKVTNLPKLLDWWGPPEEVKASETNEKILHILPGQRSEFALPEGWKIKEWKYYDDLHQFNRFAQQVPFHLWVIYLYGGITFPARVASQVLPFWSEKEIVIKFDSVSAPKGTLREKIRELLNTKLGMTIKE
jgi:GR25 family glycosyltransferase involved in LPS biosynthesis